MEEELKVIHTDISWIIRRWFIPSLLSNQIFNQISTLQISTSKQQGFLAQMQMKLVCHEENNEQSNPNDIKHLNQLGPQWWLLWLWRLSWHHLSPLCSADCGMCEHFGSAERTISIHLKCNKCLLCYAQEETNKNLLLSVNEWSNPSTICCNKNRMAWQALVCWLKWAIWFQLCLSLNARVYCFVICKEFACSFQIIFLKNYRAVDTICCRTNFLSWAENWDNRQIK